MEIFSPHPGLMIWTVLSLLHIILGYIGALKMVKLDLELWVKILWLIAILCIPIVGIATFFIVFNRMDEAEG